MLFVFFQLYLFREVIDIAVHAGADITGLLRVLEHLGVLTLPGAHDRGKYLYSCALGQLHYPVNYLVDALLLYLPAALRAVRHAYPRPEKAEIVVYLRDRAHCGARVFRRCFLVDGYRRRKPVNIIHVRLVHLAKEHPCV